MQPHQIGEFEHEGERFAVARRRPLGDVGLRSLRHLGREGGREEDRRPQVHGEMAVEERGIKVICKANTKAIVGDGKVEIAEEVK